MSIVNLGALPASAAGSSLAQSSGSDVERARQDVLDQQRRLTAEGRADRAAGIADGDDLGTNDRDADGRRPWIIPSQPRRASTTLPLLEPGNAAADLGGHLDLTV